MIVIQQLLRCVSGVISNLDIQCLEMENTGKCAGTSLQYVIGLLLEIDFHSNIILVKLVVLQWLNNKIRHRNPDCLAKNFGECTIFIPSLKTSSYWSVQF